MITKLSLEKRALAEELRKTSESVAISEDTSETLKKIADRIETARSTVTPEMKRLAPEEKRNPAVGGIPVDSEYIIFVIDTSGSMQTVWPRVVREVDNILTIHPEVKGIQVMNDMGLYMFSRYKGQWIPDSPARRDMIRTRLSSWAPFSNSSPVEGVSSAIRRFYDQDKKISIYIMGDEFTGNSIGNVLAAIGRANARDKSGDTLVRVHAIGFPSFMPYSSRIALTAQRYANLMRHLAYDNNGTFFALGR